MKEQIKVTIQEKNEIKQNSPETLPLNPTGQGYSGQEIRRKLFNAISGNKGSLLVLVADKMQAVYDFVEFLENSKLSLEGGKMTGSIDMDNHDINNVNEMNVNKIYGYEIEAIPGSPLTIKSHLYLDNNLISDVADGQNSKDAVNLGQLNTKAKKPSNQGDANFDTLYMLKEDGTETFIKIGHVIAPKVAVMRGNAGHIYSPNAISGEQVVNFNQLSEHLDLAGAKVMTGNLNMGMNDIGSVDRINVNEITSLGSVVIIHDEVDMVGQRISDLGVAIYDTDAINKKQVEDKIVGHDDDINAHLHLRNLIQALQQEIDRLDGKGKSYGMIDKTQNQLLGMDDNGRWNAIHDFLDNKFDGYSPAIGDLIYTKTVAGQNEHEWEYNGSIWVDNGAWTIEKGSNSEYGLVKGDGDYVSIVGGIMQILKSDYATRLGNSTNWLDYVALNNIVNEVTNNIYKKVDVYTKTETNADFYTKLQIIANYYTRVEIDTLLNQLKAVYGWQDTHIGDFVSHSDSFDNMLDYDFLILSGTYNNEYFSQIVNTLTIKPNNDFNIGDATLQATSANNGTLTYTSGSGTIALYGVKMEQQESVNIAYEGTNVENELNRIREVGENIIERDSFGNVIKITSPYGETNFVRDNQNNVIQINEEIEGVEYETTITRDYNQKIIKIKKEKVN